MRGFLIAAVAALTAGAGQLLLRNEYWLEVSVVLLCGVSLAAFGAAALKRRRRHGVAFRGKGQRWRDIPDARNGW